MFTCNMCSIDSNCVSNNPYKNNIDMKANEAPEKIYYAPYGDMRVNDPITENDIEYTQTDAFIEKACAYLDEKCRKFILTAKDIEDFKNYMKGE